MLDVSSKRIGILGGSFNPVHIGHLIVAQGATEALDLSKMLFIPCATPPHKNVSGMAEASHRMNMLENAAEHDPRFEICDIEIQRGGVSYTIDTVTQLQEENPGADLFFIIGSDTLKELHLWKRIPELLALCEFVTFVRPGFEVDNVKHEELKLDPPWPASLLNNITPGVRVDISSSDIRHRVAEGLSVRYLVPETVEMYIAEHSLYLS